MAMPKFKGTVCEYLNSLCDDIIYSNNNSSKVASLIFPLMAGTTNPDPEYFIRRHQDDAVKYLYVLEYVISGKGYIECDNHKYTVEAGDFYLINRYALPYYYPDPKQPYTKIWVNISGRFMNALTYAYQITEPIVIAHYEEAEGYIRAIHEELLKYPIQETHKSYDSIMNILLSLFQGLEKIRKSTSSTKNPVSFAEITDYISNNIIIDKLDVEYISTYFYMSYSSLYRLCMKNVGLSPKHYILKLKVEYAQALFASSKHSISRVSDALNFSSPAYFRKVFKKYTGMSPAEWIKGQEKKR